MKKAPQDDKNNEIKMDLNPLDLILFKLTEYSAESEVLSLFFFLKMTMETIDPIMPNE